MDTEDCIVALCFKLIVARHSQSLSRNLLEMRSKEQDILSRTISRNIIGKTIKVISKTKAKVKGSSVLSVYKTVAEPRIPDVMAVLSAPQPESLAVSDLDINEKALKFNDRCEILNVENVKKERKNKIWEGIESFSDFHTELKKEGF